MAVFSCECVSPDSDSSASLSPINPADSPLISDGSPIHFNAAWDLGMRPVLKKLPLPTGLKECLSSLNVIEKDGSHQVFHWRSGEELDWEMCSVSYCYVCVRQRLAHSWWERRILLPILKGRKTEKGDICNFITTLMGFSIIQELHFLMHWAHKYKVQ